MLKIGIFAFFMSTSLQPNKITPKNKISSDYEFNFEKGVPIGANATPTWNISFCSL